MSFWYLYFGDAFDTRENGFKFCDLNSDTQQKTKTSVTVLNANYRAHLEHVAVIMQLLDF